MKLTFAELTGKSEEHLEELSSTKIKLHAMIMDDFNLLQRAAKEEGFDLQVASGFRSFERQLIIFQSKLEGKRPILNPQSERLDPSSMSLEEKIMAICFWSAIPGASRHHWGTDFDFFDRAPISSDYQLQLIPAEYNDGGPFAECTKWLLSRTQDPEFPFFFPYLKKGAMALEPWHLSHRLSLEYERAYTLDIFTQNILDLTPEMQNILTPEKEKYYTQFIQHYFSLERL